MVNEKITEIFDCRYLKFAERDIDYNITRQEADLIINLGRLNTNDHILEVGCGEGRILRMLASRGLHVSGVDASEFMVTEAQRKCVWSKYAIAIDCDDLLTRPREILSDCILSWNTSFGFQSDPESLQILKNMRRSLKNNGRLILNIANKNNVLKKLKKSQTRYLDILKVVDKMWFEHETSRLYTLRTFELERISQVQFYTRLFSPSEIVDFVSNSGFREIQIHNPKSSSVLFNSQIYLTAKK